MNMKYFTLKTIHAYLRVLTAGLLLLCVFGSADQARAGQKTTSMDVKKETKEALQAIKEYSADQRDMALQEVERLLDSLDSRIEDIQERFDRKWAEMDQATRRKMRQTLEELQKRRNEISEWYGGMKHSSVKAWDTVKGGFVEGYSAVAEAFDKAEDEFDAAGE